MWILALALVSADPGIDLRYVDYQAALQALPAAREARQTLVAARRRSQARIDRHRRQFLLERVRLPPAEVEERARALDAEIDAAETALDAMQTQALEPLLAELDAARARLASGPRVVVRLDQVPLIGWPKACDLTDALVEAANGAEPEPEPVPQCRTAKLRVVDVAALAGGSPQAKAARAELERFRRQEQADIDEELARVEVMEAKAETPEAKAEAAEARRVLDLRVGRTRSELQDRERAAEQAVLDAIYRRLEAEAPRLHPTALVEAPPDRSALPDIRWEDGLGWAQVILRE